jgi:hypothetical protein
MGRMAATDISGEKKEVRYLTAAESLKIDEELMGPLAYATEQLMVSYSLHTADTNNDAMVR